MSADDQRLTAACTTCGESVDVPDKGMGRAVLAAWRTQHQGHDVEQESRRGIEEGRSRARG